MSLSRRSRRVGRRAAAAAREAGSSPQVPQRRESLGGTVAARTAGELDAELLELAIQVSAFEAGAVSHAGHAVVLTRQVELEVDALELITGIAQRLVKRHAVLQADGFVDGCRGFGRRGCQRVGNGHRGRS